MLRVLFLAAYPQEAASTRFRVTQYFPYLEGHGVSCQLASLLSPQEFGSFYARGGFPAKAAELLAGAFKQALRAASSGRFDVVVVQRGALLFGPPLLEWWIARAKGVPLVFDFDDAVWLNPASSWGWLARLTRFPSKVAQIIRMAQHVIVCNEYTRDYALKFRSPDAVTVIPTVVDADVFHPVPRRSSKITIGWVGTHTTAQYITSIIEPLQQVAAQHDFTLKIVGSGRVGR